MFAIFWVYIQSSCPLSKQNIYIYIFFKQPPPKIQESGEITPAEQARLGHHQNVKSDFAQINSQQRPKLYFQCFGFVLNAFKCECYFAGTNTPECFKYRTLDDSTRRIGGYSGKLNDDNKLVSDWYRFVTGYMMPSRSSSSSGPYCGGYGTGYCDSGYNGVLIGSHPSSGQIIQSKVCFSSSRDSCCNYYKYIYVRNCGSFYVYQLKPTCSSCRYCTLY